MKAPLEASLVYEGQYQSLGMRAQRHYPNEALMQFFGRYCFDFDRPTRERMRVLELGCGTGANLWMVAKENFSAYGIDVAPSGLELCKQKLVEWQVRATLIQADMRSLPFRDQWCDVIFDVVSMQCLDLAGHRDAYREVARCLKPRGLFFQYHSGSESYSFKYGGGSMIDEATVDDIRAEDAPLRGNGMMSFLTPLHLAELLAESGLAIKELETVDRTYRSRAIRMQYLAVVCGRAY